MIMVSQVLVLQFLRIKIFFSINHWKQNNSTTKKHILSYGINGLLLNSFGYLLYIKITAFGILPTVAITITYPLGIILSYFVHKKYTFHSDVNTRTIKSLSKFIIIYLFGYLLNFIILYIFHELFNLPHEVVQIFAILLLIFILFNLNRRFVFK